MYSRILTKLISEAVYPFFGFLFIKIIVTLFTARGLGINTDLFNIFNLSVSAENYNTINSNVLFGFIIFAFIGLSYSLVKSIFFHSTHIAPRLSLSVLNFRVGFLIQDTFHLFSQNLIWLFFSYSTLFMTLFLYYLGLCQGYLIVLSTILTLVGTYFLILDVEYEMEKFNTMEEEEEIFVS